MAIREGADRDVAEMLRQVVRLEALDRPAQALDEAWRSLDKAPGSRAAKVAVARLLQQHPEEAVPSRLDDIARLVIDPEVDPFAIASAAWLLLLREGPWSEDVDPAVQAAWLDAHPLVSTLLVQAHVRRLDVELKLTRVRRWLLLSQQWPLFPSLVDALGAQAEQNGGAWLFDDEEKTALAAFGDPAITKAYLTPRSMADAVGDHADDITRDTWRHYESWPYPPWNRITVPPPDSLRRVVGKLGGGADFPAEPEVLLAGCGTGREAAVMAATYPDARITAIDISESSLAYARTRCAGQDIDFRCLDLHRVAELGREFDFIHCGGVLQTLPDPETGWARLVDVLRPGGAMRVMVNSRTARLPVLAARRLAADLLDRTIDDDLLRAVRRRLIDSAPELLRGSTDFYTLAGMRVLLHSHEDAFDVSRIARALDRLGLDLLFFRLPAAAAVERYRREHPSDPNFRDLAAWKALEKRSPFLFAGMYDFWCLKPA
jgi:SAM-dependent methyltransferase